MTYFVNNIAVGHSPDEIERIESYKTFFEKVGNSADSIVIIPNFLSEQEINYLMASLSDENMRTFVSQKDENDNPTNWMNIYRLIVDKFKLIERIKTEVVKSYEFDRIESRDQWLSVVRWDKGTKLQLHVDDLGYETDNHIATLVYLNDDYDGGEVAFATHDVTVKPKTGDLLIFPGNMHYAHEVKEILSGTRYTVPVWFTIQ
jgi:Rps23 Pro-64 3,4-dihydroxylase Tpa1-like proline 4-hydroxylase